MVFKRKKKKESFLRVVANIVRERHSCASAVLGLFPVTKAEGVQAFSKLHMPDLSISKCTVSVCVLMLFMWECKSRQMGASWRKTKELYELTKLVVSFFFWGGEKKTHIRQLIIWVFFILFYCFFKSIFLFTCKQLLFYIERQFDIFSRLLCSEPVVPP